MVNTDPSTRQGGERNCKLALNCPDSGSGPKVQDFLGVVSDRRVEELATTMHISKGLDSEYKARYVTQ